jgi:cytochrome P450
VLRSSVSRKLRPAILNAVGLRHFRRFFGLSSVGVAEGAVWKRGRAAIKAGLKTPYIRSLHGEISACVDACAALLRQRSEHGATPVDVSPINHATALDMIGHVLLREELGALHSLQTSLENPVAAAFAFAENEIVRRTASLRLTDWLYWKWLGRLGLCESQRAFDDAHDTIRTRVRQAVTKRLAQTVRHDDDDLLRHLLGLPGAHRFAPAFGCAWRSMPTRELRSASTCALIAPTCALTALTCRFAKASRQVRTACQRRPSRSASTM